MKNCYSCRQKKSVKKIYLCHECLPVLTPSSTYNDLAVLQLKTTFGKALDKKDTDQLFSISQQHPETISQVYQVILSRLEKIGRSLVWTSEDIDYRKENRSEAPVFIAQIRLEAGNISNCQKTIWKAKSIFAKFALNFY